MGQARNEADGYLVAGYLQVPRSINTENPGAIDSPRRRVMLIHLGPMSQVPVGHAALQAPPIDRDLERREECAKPGCSWGCLL